MIHQYFILFALINALTLFYQLITFLVMQR